MGYFKVNGRNLQSVRFPNGEEVISTVGEWIKNYSAKNGNKWLPFDFIEWHEPCLNDLPNLNYILSVLSKESDNIQVTTFGGFPFQRMDKDFFEHGTSESYCQVSLDIVNSVINKYEAASLAIMDPHSYSLRDYDLGYYACFQNIMSDIKAGDVIVFPDKTAFKKYFQDINDLQVGVNYIVIEKNRDPKTGKIVSSTIKETSVPLHYMLNKFKTSGECSTKFYVIDDICDGGRTFLEAKKAIVSEASWMDQYPWILSVSFHTHVTKCAELFDEFAVLTNNFKYIMSKKNPFRKYFPPESLFKVNVEDSVLNTEIFNKKLL